jgi:hypothetical protein
MLRRPTLIALLGFPQLVRAQVIGLAARIGVLTELVKAIGAAGDAMTKLVAGFTSVAVAGNDAYNHVAAARERDQLVEISRQTALLIGSQNAMVVASIDEYLQSARHTQREWINVVENIDATLSKVSDLLADVRQNRSDFVLEPAFEELTSALMGRVSLLTRLRSLSAPSTPEELQLLGQASEKYKRLIAAANEALSGLNAYIKAHK